MCLKISFEAEIKSETMKKRCCFLSITCHRRRLELCIAPENTQTPTRKPPIFGPIQVTGLSFCCFVLFCFVLLCVCVCVCVCVFSKEKN